MVPQTRDEKNKRRYIIIFRFDKPKSTMHYLFWFQCKLTAIGTQTTVVNSIETLMYSVIRKSGLSGFLNSMLIQWETG
jgi:hypothetical protein